VLTFTLDLGLIAQSVSGLAAEAIGALAYVPSDIVSQKLQMQTKYNFLYREYQYKGTIDVVKSILKLEGVKGLYRGYVPYMIVYGPGSAVRTID
jgi:hypothetical protein